jgi:hypothetical protein
VKRRTRRVRLKPDCTFGARLRLRRGARVQARYAGNAVLAAQSRRVRVR